MAFLVVNIDKEKKGMHQRIHLSNLVWYTLTNLDIFTLQYDAAYCNMRACVRACVCSILAPNGS
jgi:hypothetical protein